MDPNLAVKKPSNGGRRSSDNRSGGESTRPGSDPVSEKEEIRRVIPILEKLPLDQFLISIDTTKAEVARLSLELGAHIINDVSGVTRNFSISHRKINLGLSSCTPKGTLRICRSNHPT